jgi:hypothetical protein
VANRQPVGFIQHQELGRPAGPDFGQDFVYMRSLFAGLFRGDIHHVQDERRLRHLLERGAERLHQGRR